MFSTGRSNRTDETQSNLTHNPPFFDVNVSTGESARKIMGFSNSGFQKNKKFAMFL